MIKLDAVNEILSRCGFGHVSALNTNGSDLTAEIERVIDRHELAVQSEGWHWNRRKNVSLEPVLFTFDSAAYTAASKTLTQAGKFTDASVGCTLVLSGTGVTLTTTTIATLLDDDSVTVTDAIAAGNLGGGVAGRATTNTIPFASTIIEIDTERTSELVDVSPRGGKLFNLEDNTDQFESAMTMTYLERLDWGCLPLLMRRYIMLLALGSIQDHQLTKQNAARVRTYFNEAKYEDEVRRARAQLMRLHNRMGDVNMFDTEESERFRGGRSLTPEV